MNHVDVLIVTALREEYQAAKVAAQIEGRGIEAWNTVNEDGVNPYLWGRYRTADGRSFKVALARPTRMGGRSMSGITTVLVERLRPSLLAMSGICAGNPTEVAIGDVVVAEMAFQWDEGMHVTGGFEPDQHQIAMDPIWLREAQEFDPSTLPSFGAATEDEAMLWLLERLNQGQDPRNDPLLKRYFPTGTWVSRLERFEAAGVIVRDGHGPVRLTEAGTALVRRRLYDDVDGPTTLPFAVRVGPMASGSAAMGSDRIWKQLVSQGVRTIAAVDMEAATIATIAQHFRLPWLVAKGVMDHAEIDRDDRYKELAARASSEVLYALVEGALRNRRIFDHRAETQPRPKAKASDASPRRYRNRSYQLLRLTAAAIMAAAALILVAAQQQDPTDNLVNDPRASQSATTTRPLHQPETEQPIPSQSYEELLNGAKQCRNDITARASIPEVTIASPKPGTVVVDDASFSGVAHLAPGQHLYFFFYRPEPFCRYYLIPDREIVPKADGSWSSGWDLRRSPGQRFLGLAVVVNEVGHRALRDVLKGPMPTSSWNFARLPSNSRSAYVDIIVAG